jgi:abequosyltransferase
VQLSICIATYNRGRFIGETLDSIIDQLRPGVEVVIVDGASPDNTADVISPYSDRIPSVRYFREAVNSGFDLDLEKAVSYASGEYCWMLSDDDFVKPYAIDRILNALDHDSIDLLIVEHDVIDATLTRPLHTDRFSFKGERIYRPEDSDELMADAASTASFIGSTIIRRSLWKDRQRERYFNSMFVHVGVIFQEPAIEQIKLLAEPLVTMRAGNNMWRSRGFEIWAFKWPGLIWGFSSYSDEAKRKVFQKEPWRDLVWMMGFRGLGAYSYSEYVKQFSGRQVGAWRIMLILVALFPGRLANFLGICALAVLGKGGGVRMYDLIASSSFSNPASRLLASLWLGKAAWPPSVMQR